MKKIATGTVVAFRAGEIEKKKSASAMLRCGRDALFVNRPTMKGTILAANRLARALGWTMEQPWKREGTAR